MNTKKKRNRGKKAILIIVIALVVLLAGTCITMKLIFPGIGFVKPCLVDTVTSSAGAFRYDPSKIETGTVYHYVKSNIDGTKPGDVAIYVSTPEHLEVFKIYPGANATFYVTSDMDWGVFTPKALDGYELHKDGSKVLVMHAELDKAKNEFAYAAGKDSYTVPIGHYPVHNFNFDLTSLNFSFRHLADPESEVSVGIHYPAFDLAHFVKFTYTGQALIKYVGDETRGDATCRKYEVSGEGLLNCKGTLWADKEKGYIVDMELPVSDNPGWSTFKLKLIKIETMIQDEWNNYMATQTSDYFTKQGK
jgi:flagellar basal body-associated protein FliL